MDALTVKPALLLPPGTVTVEGTWAKLCELERDTINPPSGAEEPSVTVPVADCPLTIEAGVTLTFVTFGGNTVRLPLRFTVASAKATVTVWLPLTGLVPIGKELPLAPSGTMTGELICT